MTQVLVVLVLNTSFSRPTTIHIHFKPLEFLAGTSAWYISKDLFCSSSGSSASLCHAPQTQTIAVTIVMSLAGLFLWSVFRANVVHLKYNSLLDGIRSVDLTLGMLIVGTVVHAASLSSSSFVEEEHQTWYFWCVTLLLVLAWRDVRERWRFERLHSVRPELGLGPDVTTRNIQAELGDWPVVIRWCFEQRREIGWLLVLGMIGGLRRLNQTGDKWLSVPDVGDWLVSESNRGWHSLWTGSGECCCQDCNLSNIWIFNSH